MVVARSGRRAPKPAEVWQARAVDAYAKGSALHDAMRMAEAPGALVAQDAAARWADIQRRADDLGQALYAMREVAPDEDKRMCTADVLAALQSVRSVMAAERGTDVTSVPPPEMVRSRLMAFGAALQALRAPDDGMPRFATNTTDYLDLNVRCMWLLGRGPEGRSRERFAHGHGRHCELRCNREFAPTDDLIA